MPDGPIVKGHSSGACQLPRMVTLKGKEGMKSSPLCSAPTVAFSCLPKLCNLEVQTKLALPHLRSTRMIRGVSLPSLSVYRHQAVVHHLQMLLSREKSKLEEIHVVIFPSFTAGTAEKPPTPVLGAFSSFKEFPAIHTARLGSGGNLVFKRAGPQQQLSEMPQNKQIWSQLSTLLPDCQKI